MKALACGDLHIGRRHQGTYRHIDRLKVSVQQLYDAANLCLTLNIPVLILNGDVLDKSHGSVPDLGVLLAVYYALQYAKGSGLEVYWVRGNHEIWDHSDLTKNVMFLYAGVCHLVAEPQSITSDSGVIMMIPWYPDTVFAKRLYEEAAMLVRRETRTCVLFTHAGLAEGRTSPSNYQIPQPISIVDLFPSAWNAIFLSDYHMHQAMAENAWYMGAPIPHQFGDEGNVGFWVCDLKADSYSTVDPIWDGEYWNGPIQAAGPGNCPRYPRFQRWSVTDSGERIPINPADYNEVRCPPHLIEHFSHLYPTARCLPLEASLTEVVELPTEAVRLRKDDIVTSYGIIQAWLRYKNRVDDKDLERIGLELLGN